MATLPALSRSYHRRADVPFADVTTASRMAKSNIWALKALLMDQVATGVVGSTTRPAGSVWTCLGSSDGAAGALDGVDRWGSSFNQAKIVWGNDGSPHSWIALQNTALGVQLVIDCQTTTESTILFAFTPIASPLSGGSGGTVNSRPFRAGTEVDAGYTGTAFNNWITNWFSDTTTGGNSLAHFLTAADGSFLFFSGRQGIGFPTCVIGLQRSVDSAFMPKRSSDTNNVMFIGGCSGSMSSPGAFNMSTWTSSFGAGCVAQRLPNLQPMTQGGLMRPIFGSNEFVGANAGADAVTLDYPAFPLVCMALAPQHLARGSVADFFFHGNRVLIPTGTVDNPGGVTAHLAVGDVWIPWEGAVPTF